MDNNYGSTALHLAANEGKDAVVTQLVNVNANVNAVDNNYGDTPRSTWPRTMGMP